MEARLQERVAQLARPENSRPPTDRNLDNSYTLHCHSLETVLPTEWLDDSIVNTFFRNLCLVRPGEYVAFDSNTLDSLRQMLESGSPALTQPEIDELYRPFRILAATISGNKGVVFMPFCVQDHWVLVVADLYHQVIRVYDSLVSCTSLGIVTPSRLVKGLLPLVKRTMAFCSDEDQWAVEHMWLPITRTFTECGVYTCLMGLQHAYTRMFNLREYAVCFYDENKYWTYYCLEECYWLAGRTIIFHVCSIYFKPTSRHTRQRVSSVGRELDRAFRSHIDSALAQDHDSKSKKHSFARSWTLDRVIDALEWFIHSIEGLGSKHYLQRSEFVLGRARQVVLTPLGMPFRNEIVDEAVNYAWHDVEALRTFRTGLSIARDGLIHDPYPAQARSDQRSGSLRGKNMQGGPQASQIMVHDPRPENNDSAASRKFEGQFTSRLSITLT